MDSQHSSWTSDVLSGLWPAGQEEDVYEVESLVPLPHPFPFTWDLNDKNAILVNTSISHVNHKKNGHILKVVSQISLPTPPYSLEHAKATQTELVRESIKRKQEITDLLKSQDELQERLNEEARAREHLASELSKAEGLLDGYTDERVSLEKQMQEKTDLIHRLEQELQSTGNRLQELEEERQQVQVERELLSRQKDAMKADATSAELRVVDAAVDAAPKAELLEETEKLMKEKIEVQRQAEKEHEDLYKQLKVLETEMEEQMSRSIELEQERNADIADLRQKNQALEKQLDKTRKFLDEQAVDREHERDVFQQEIQKLEQQLKIPQKLQPVNEDQTREVERLSNHLQERTDKCSELFLTKEQLQRDVQERNEEIEKLECRIRELEQALIISTDDLQQVDEMETLTTVDVKGELPLEAQLQVEREAIDRKENEITNLEEQLEQFREELENKIEEVQQLHMQLEIQRKESTTRLQELEQENKLFKDELENLGMVVHISEAESSANYHYVHSGKFTPFMQEKDKEIDHLNEQIAKLQQQLEDVTDSKVTETKNEQIGELEAQVECLKSDQERVMKNSSEEIEQLNDVIEKLQQELANIEGKVPVDLSIISEDGDSLKHQLDTVLAENRKLQQIIDTNNAEVTLTKRELKEANDQMKLLKEQLKTWEIEQGILKQKANSVIVNSIDVLKAGDSRDKTEKLEEALRENAAKSLTYQSLLTSVEKTTQDTVSNMELKLKELQDTVMSKDSELSECSKQIQILEEQNESERTVLENRLLEMEEKMQENLAAVLVSQVQLKAVQVQTKYIQNMEANSTKFDNVLNSSAQSTSKAQAESQVSALTLQLFDMNSQLSEMHEQLRFEKEQVNKSQREAAEKEEQLSDLRKIIENLQESHTKQVTKELLRMGEITPPEVPAGGTSIKQNAPLAELQFELEKIRAEAATVKEELNNYREKTEKLTEELSVKEMSFSYLQEDLGRVKQSLTEAEMKLEQYVKLGYELADQKNVDFGSGRALAVDGSHLITTTASSQTDKVLTVNNSNQTVLVNQRDLEIQKDFSHTEKVCSSEKVAEVLNQYTEKIIQMQELHAAEILDMEARHISEAEALRREKFVAVQALTEECEDLRAMIESLSTKRGITVSGMQHSTSYQNTEGTYSDNAPDWSQGTDTAKGFIPTSERMSAETEASTFLIPDKIKGLLRAVHLEGMQVLSLSEEYPNSEKDIPSLTQGLEEWFDERKGFLNAIAALKDLIAKMQVHKGQLHENSELSEQIPDWRGELLGAIQDVFLRDQDVLVAAFHTQLAALGNKNAALLVNQLKDRLQEQGMEHINAMDCIRNADRRSLLLEIQALRARKSGLQMDDKNKLQMDPNSQGLKAQNVLSAYTSVQEKFTDASPRSAELQEQLHSERLTIAELKTELAQTTLELESTLKAQHKHFKELDALREDVTEKAAALDTLNDTLADEQKRTRELQWALEKGKAKMERIEERGKEELEDLTFSLEDHKLKVEQLNELLEEQRSLVTELQQKVESQEAQYKALLSQERGRNAEIQVILEAEKVRAVELSDALDREKELCAQLQSNEGKEHDGVQDSHTILLKELQSQLTEKHNRIVELVSDMEAQKLASLQMGQKLEDEGHLCKKALISEQEASKSAHKKMGELQAKLEELQWQLEEKLEQVQKLQEQDRLFQERIKDLQSKERDGGKTNQSQSEQENVDSNVTEWDTSSERTKSWILQQKEVATEAKDSGFPTQLEMNGGDAICGSDMAVESIRNRLQQVSSKLRQLATKAAKRILFEAADDEDFVWSQNSIQDVLFQLQRLPELPSLGKGDVMPSGGSTRTLTERLLRQNAELTGYVSRLTEEKNDLRNILIKLEEELRRYRERSVSWDHSPLHLLDNKVHIDALIGSEREMWNREKRALQKSLKQAEAELSKLRAELRNDAVQRDLGGDSESMALKRMYGKFLRSESFRKALIYQKKYLLLLLGGFQECEEATLALIARMGGQPCYTDLEAITHHSRGFTRFRSAVRVSIAISRMKFLVRRWQRALGTSTASVNRNGFGQSSANETRTDSPYLPSVGLELYGEQRLSSSRSRSGMESPRSTVNSQHRYHGVPADLGPCSHLQNYDPDRALTDYINRLESLQRRLGNVQSGSSSAYNQPHYATRR